jgi:hypothetical protein
MASAVREIDPRPASPFRFRVAPRVYNHPQQSSRFSTRSRPVGLIAEMTTRAFSSRPPRAKARPAGARDCLAEVARALLFGLLFALVVSLHS